jgi:hypothetical protein
VADNVAITAGAGTTIATDDVGGSHFQRVKLVDGTLDSSTAIASGGGVEAGALRVTIASDSTGVVSIDDNGASLTVDGTITANLAAGTNYAGKVRLTDGTTDTDVRDLANSNALNVAIVDGSGDQIISFGGGTQYTEDAAAAANPVGTAPILIRSDTPATQVTTDGDNIAQRGTNYGAAYVQVVSSAGAFVDTFGGGTQYTEGNTDATITGTAMLMEGAGDTLVVAPGTAADGLLVNLGANNDVTVTGTVTANLAAGTNNIGDVDVLTVPAPLSTTGGGTEAAALRVTIANDSTGVLSIDDNGASITVDGTVTANLAAGTNNIGDVDVLTLPALVAGTAFIGKVQITDGTNDAVVDTVHGDAESNTENHLDVAAKLMGYNGTTWDRLRSDTTNGLDVDVVRLPASTNTLEVVGDVAHSIAVAGNPVLIAGAAQAHDDTAPPNRVDAEGDATRLATDYDGSLFVRPHGPQVWTYHLNTSTAQTDASVHAAPGAGLSLYVGTIVFSSGAATAINMFLEEGASTVMGPYYLEATAGRGLCIQFNPPRKITANTALTITTSASIAHSVDITGFTAQG